MSVDLLLVGIGGASGSILRWLTGEFVARQGSTSQFPTATFTVNLVGCFLIGAIAALSERYTTITPQVRLLVITGFLGGFTTFSAFGYETISLLRSGKMGLALSYILLSVLGGLLAVTVGQYLFSARA